jgi:hypothetical protein
MNNSSLPPIEPLSFDELSKVFSVTSVTLNKWMAPYFKEIGEPEEEVYGIKKYSTKQVKLIFEKLDFIHK